jgi:hypothetical protein
MKPELFANFSIQSASLRLIPIFSSFFIIFIFASFHLLNADLQISSQFHIFSSGHSFSHLLNLHFPIPHHTSSPHLPQIHALPNPSFFPIPVSSSIKPFPFLPRMEK